MIAPQVEVSGSWDQRSEVVTRAVQGDSEAISALIHLARPMVLRWAMSRTGCEDEAEDVTQKVLLRVYCHLPSFRREASFSSWLFRITVNEASGHWRQELKRRAKTAKWWSAPGSSPSTPAALDRLAAERASDRVHDLACVLPPLQSDVFRLVDLCGMHPCEAARHLHRTQTNVRSSLCRARKKLRALLEQRGGGWHQ